MLVNQYLDLVQVSQATPNSASTDKISQNPMVNVFFISYELHNAFCAVSPFEPDGEWLLVLMDDNTFF